jgi:hypothetical protein
VVVGTGGVSENSPEIRSRAAADLGFLGVAVDEEAKAARLENLRTGDTRAIRSASALLEQNEARSGQHALLSSGQAPVGVSLRQVADDLDDLDQIP